MALRLKREDDLLDPAFRSRIIQELDHQSNIERKGKMFRRHDMYRDNTKAYVAETIRCEQGDEALAEIQHRISNISLLKVVINKKSMVYASGAKREVVGDEKSQAQIDQIIDLLNFNSNMKKANRWEELFKNAIVQIYPYKNDITQKWRIKLELNVPYKIDVLEDENNNEEARCYIYSYFAPQATSLSYAPVGQSGVHSGLTMTGSNAFDTGAGVNQKAQEELCANEKREYIWWSTKYHFTTDEKGVIINENVDAIESVKNPVMDIPYVNISTNQDGNFWAVGGEDLVDGSMLVNLFLTEIYYIAKYQGMGLFYLFGRGVPKRIKVGPSQALTLDVKPEDPTPQIGFASSNPNISEYMNSIKEYIAALMKTNKLEPASVMGFESVMQASSGFQELLQKSELYETLEDAKEAYRDAEPLIFKKYIKWHNFLLDRGLLDDEFAQIGRINENIKVVTKFYPAQSTMTEKEKLEVIKMRQEIGLDSMVDSIMKDNTELTREEAIEKSLEILKQKAIDARSKMIDSFKMEPKSEDESEDDEEDESEKSGKQGVEEESESVDE